MKMKFNAMIGNVIKWFTASYGQVSSYYTSCSPANNVLLAFVKYSVWNATRHWASANLPAVIVTCMFLVIVLPGHSFGGGGDSTKVHLSSTNLSATVKQEIYRTFEGLNAGAQMDFENEDPIVLPTVLLPDSVMEKRNYAYALLEKVKSTQRFRETLSSLAEIDLPVGIVKSGGALDYSILIDRMTFTTKGAVMDVYVSLALKTGDRIAFNGKVPLSKEGGIAGTARIFLVGDHFIKFSSKSQLVLRGNKNTFVEFDCNGFVGVGIEAEMQFSRDLIIPEGADGKITNDSTRVKVNIATYAQSLTNMMVSVTVPPFQVKGMNGFGFTVTRATLDWSDSRNPEGLVFPPGYSSPFVDAGQPQLWQGFYLDQLEVRLPASFAKKKSETGKGSEQRITISVNHMLLDDEGFSGVIAAAPVIALGDMSGWSYSIDKLGIEFVTNQVKGFDLRGMLTIPVLKSKNGTVTQFGYVAQRSADGNYIFSVKIENELNFPLFVADLKLAQGSSVVVTERNDKFYPTAILNGELNIKAAKAVFNSLKFEGLRISSEDPQFDLAAIGFGKEGSEPQTLSNYPLVIKNIMLRKENNRIGIGFDVIINIGGKPNEDGFGGTAALTVWGKRDKENVTAADGSVTGTTDGGWKFDKVDVSGIGVNFKKAGVIEIAGTIRFFENDPVYGDGFKGSLSGKIQIITLQVEALFGKTPNYRYWFADAMVSFESGLPLFSGFSCYGFGGGFYSRMKQNTSGGVKSPLGQTASGVAYIPDENSFGIKALVKFGCTGSQMPYNGDVALAVELNNHGGINAVTFTGNLHVMTPPPIVQTAIAAAQMVAAAVDSKGDGAALDKFGDPAQGAVSAHVKIFFDNVNDVLHANMEMYINVAAGIVKGVGQNNRAGWAVMHFEKDDWYVLIGTPTDPVGLEILWTFKTKSYFMLGKHLPGSPPPPKQVSEILHINAADLDYMRDLNAIESGLGFAFGMNMGVDTGDLRFLMFYGRFAAGIGSDFMLKRYGQSYHCAGSDQPIGINGWYANGQAYAYIQGKIGIKVNLKFYKGNYDILNIGAAAILQAKGPNPFWMKGIVGGNYKILGGLVKGSCKFEMVLGKECNIVGNSNPLDDVKIIAQVSPASGQKDVDVFTAPQVAFNIPVNRVFDITDLEGRKHQYRAYLDEFAVLSGTTPLTGALEWNDDGDVAIFNSRDILPGEKKLKARVKLTFEENLNGAWTKVKFDGQIVDEVRENEFETGKAPDYIPASNVSISYPMAGQVNFYPKEYNQGFIQLKQGQSYLFKAAGNAWVQKMRMTNSASKRYVETDFSYNETDKKITFSMPVGFENEKVYNFEILNIPLSSTVVDANVQKVQTEIGSGENTATLTTKKIEGELENLEIKTVYTSNFRTSKYNTFVEKLSAIKLNATMNIPAVSGDLAELVSYAQGLEAMEKFELEGVNGYPPVVGIQAVLSDNDWYTKWVYPLVYDGYPLLGAMRTARDTSLLGLPPVRSVYLNSYSKAPELQPETTDVTTVPFSCDITYDLMRSMLQDYRSIQQKVVNYVVDRPDRLTDRLQKILTTRFPFYRFGKYRVRLKYRIPGVRNATSSFDWELFNNVSDN